MCRSVAARGRQAPPVDNAPTAGDKHYQMSLPWRARYWARTSCGAGGFAVGVMGSGPAGGVAGGAGRFGPLFCELFAVSGDRGAEMRQSDFGGVCRTVMRLIVGQRGSQSRTGGDIRSESSHLGCAWRRVSWRFLQARVLMLVGSVTPDRHEESRRRDR